MISRKIQLFIHCKDDINKIDNINKDDISKDDINKAMR